MPRKKTPKTEQVDQATLEGWEDAEPNVAYQLVDGKLVEVPIPTSTNVATRKNRR